MPVSGNLKMWQTVTVDFLGPNLREDPATFTNYRLDVTFKNNATGQTIKVPGFFAADGNAADSNASSGNVWRAHFNPPDDGTWTYTASFRTGANVAASLDPNAGVATAINGATGSFVVGAASTTGSEFRTDGMLVQKGHYLVHAGNGEIWIKGGSDSPENFLGYTGFDGTKDQAGGALKSYSAHVQDFKAGDPTWDGGKGQGIIGAINYLAEQGVNSQYMLLMNVDGDGKDVWPWTDYTAASRTTYDVSKLAQWEKVFEHMDNKGVAAQFVLQETENDQLLGGMTVERAVYYREMVARFGHHNGVTWNMGEESSNTSAEMKQFMQRFKDLDPYDHPVVVHNWPGEEGKIFDPLLGFGAMDGISLQSTAGARTTISKYYANSDNAGDPWLLNWDEIGPAGTGILADTAFGAASNHKEAREKMWGALTAGAAGVEWYSGGQDQSLENFRTREAVWNWTEVGRKFFESMPVEQMRQMDSITASASDFVFGKAGELYVVYLPDGGNSTINLTGLSGSFNVQWFNPVTGAYSSGSVTSVAGGGVQSLGSAPNTAQDWVAVVRKGEALPVETGAQVVTGTTGADKLVGTAFADLLNGHGGKDSLDGGAGADTMYGGGDSDTYYVDNVGDRVVELAGQGNDTVHAYISYALGDNVEHLTLRGGAAISGTGNALNNRIEGNDAVNTLSGGAGDDILVGRGGADLLTGGTGRDVFDFNALSDSRADKIDRILDFAKGEDKIDLSTIDASTALLGNQAFRFIGTAGFSGAAGEVRFATALGETKIHADVNGDRVADLSVTLVGYDQGLQSSDFLL